MNKQTQSTLFSSASMEWETPAWLFKLLHSEFHFTLDVCATKANRKVKNFITKKEDALYVDWEERSGGGAAWMNPPYGRQMVKWVDKAYGESVSGRRINVVCLLPARTDTALFHVYGPHAEVRLIKGRIGFLENGEETHPAPFPSAVMIFGPKVKPSIKLWDVDAFRPEKRRRA